MRVKSCLERWMSVCEVEFSDLFNWETFGDDGMD